jgi:WD40 repeat protein/cytoskeletal protein RodZ
VGASGSGKSSLVKAALVPRLMKPQRIEGAEFLRRAVFRPGDAQDDLILGLAEALTRGPGHEGLGLPELLAPGQTAKDLAAYLRANLAAPTFVFTSALGRVTEAAVAAKRILPHEAAKIIIVVDQLEELFTLAKIGADDRRAFVQLLHGLTHSGAVWVIATMRADFWHRILDVPELLALAEGPGRLDIPAPSLAEIAEVIRKPAQAAGLRFETNGETGLGLDTVLAEHAASEPGVLPLLSFTLDALYREDIERRGGHELTFAQYDHLGGLEGAIAKRADEVVDSLPQNAQAAVPRVLRALATLGGIGHETPVARSVPLNSFPPGTDARVVVDAFVAARLLVASSEGETATVRLAHEALISRWERAREQLTADRRDLETRSLIEGQYARWHQAQGSTRDQLLLRDPDLANALDLQRRWGDELGAPVQDFIAQSHRRRRRRQQLAAAAAVVFGIVALAATVFGFIAYQAQQQAERARTRAVDAEATAVSERDRAVQQRNAALVSQSRYLAATADTLVKDGQVRSAIGLLRVALPDAEHGNKRPLVGDAIVAAYNALYSNREKSRVALPQDATALTMAPDGQSLVIAAPNRIVLRAGADGEGERALPHQFGPISRLVIDGKGEHVAMVGPGGAISVRRLADNRELTTFAGDGAGTQVFFLRGAQRLLAVSPDNKTWHLIEVETGRELAKRNLSAATPIVSLIEPEHGIIIALAEGLVHRLSADDLSDQATAPTDPAAEYALALSPDAKSIYIAAAQDILTGRILVLDSETLALQRTFGKVVGGARHVAVSPKSQWLAVHGIIGIDFFEVATGERLFHMLTSRDATRGRFTSGSDYIAYGANGFIRRYAPALGIEMAAYRMDGGFIDQIHERPDRSGFVALSDRPSATVWSYDSQIISRQYAVPLVIQGMDMRMPSPIEAFSIAADRDEVLASYIDRSARRWNLQTGDVRVVREAAIKAESIEHVASLAGGLSVLAEKSGRLLIVTDAGGGGGPAGELALEPLAYLGDLGEARAFAVTKTGVPLVIDLSSPAQPVKKAVPSLASCARQVSVPGRAICIDGTNTIRVWDSRGERLMLEWPAPGPVKLSAGYLAQDGSIMAAGFSNGEVVVRSLTDGKTILRRMLPVELSGDALKNAAENGLLSEEDAAKVRQGAKVLEVGLGALAMAISPDAKWLAVATLDRSIKLIDLASGEERRTATPYRGMGQDLAFSPNGALLAAVEVSDYRALNVYDVATGERLTSLSLGGQPSPRLIQLSSGQGFATIDKGGRILVHPIFQDWQDLVSYLAREFPESLTPKQRRAYFIE